MQLTFKPLSHAIFTLFIYMQASSVYGTSEVQHDKTVHALKQLKS